MNRQTALAVGIALALLAAAVWAAGGFVVAPRGMRVSARSPIPAAVLALGALVVWAVLARRAQAASADLTGADAWLRRHAQAFVVAIAGLAAAVSLNFQTFSAAGADASGYFSQAAMLADGRLTRDEPLASIATWSGGGATLVPLGWRATADAATQVPTYAIGLPLLMAPLHSLGGLLLASLIGPLSLALAIWAVARLADVVSGPAAAILSAVWLATSPVSLISAMQPMSDMPATAAWLFCLAIVVSITAGPDTASWRAVAAGCAAAIAVLIRPNIAPVAAIPALMLLTTRGRASAVLFAVPVAVAGALIAFVQWRWFGSPLRSGYGTADEIYALANVGANVRLYGEWLLDTHGPWLLAAPLAAVAVPSRALRWLLLFAARGCRGVPGLRGVRNLDLPALPASSAGDRDGGHVSACRNVAGPSAGGASSGRAAGDRDRDCRAAASIGAVARCVPHRRPPCARVTRGPISRGSDAGPERHHRRRAERRLALLHGPFDSPLGSDDAGRADRRRRRVSPTRATKSGSRLDEWEEDSSVRDSRAATSAALDWPPLLEAGTLMRTRAWRLRDREPFLRHGTSHTDLVR